MILLMWHPLYTILILPWMLFSAPQAPWYRVCSSCFPQTGRSVCLAGDQGSVTQLMMTSWPDTNASLTSIPARLSNLLDLPRLAWCMVTSDQYWARLSSCQWGQLRGRDGGRVVAEWAESTDKVKTISTRWIFSLKVLKQIKAKSFTTLKNSIWEFLKKVAFENEQISTFKRNGLYDFAKFAKMSVWLPF